MAEVCAITESIVRKCKDSTGGNQRFYFATHPDTQLDVTQDGDGLVTDIKNGAVVLQMFDYTPAKNTSELTETDVISDSGVGYEQKISMFFPKLEQATANTLRVLAISTVIGVAVDKNNTYHLVGRMEGLQLSAGTKATGKALADPNGSTVELTAMEYLQVGFKNGQ